MRLIGYARVSTEDQDLGRQIEALRVAGCELIYQEKISGGKEERPELGKMLQELRPGDCVVIQKLDRLGRSLSHLLRLVEGFKRDKIHFRSLTDNFDTTTSQGIFIFQIMAAVAELERSMIRERTRDGLRVKKLQGVRLGRPVKDNAELIASIDWFRPRAEVIEELNITESKYYALRKGAINKAKRGKR